MPLPVLQTASHGFPAQFNSEVANLYSNQNGDNVSVTAVAGDCLIGIAMGLRDFDPFDCIHSGTSVPGYILGPLDYNPNPVISDAQGNVWSLISTASASLSQFDYTVSATPPAAPNPYPSSKWNLDGYYLGLDIWVALNVTPGTYNVNLNSMFATGAAPQWQLGRPIFDGGVNFQVVKFGGIAAAAAQDGSSIALVSSAAAAPAAFTTTQGSELLLAVGLMKSGNVFGLGNVIQGGVATADAVNRVSNGKLVGSEAHYMVEYAVPAAANAATKLSFSNPLGYEMLVANIALKHS